MNKVKNLIVVFIWLLLPISSHADNNALLNKQRQLFQQATKALETNQISQFNKLKEQLDDYPLQPYLDYLYLRHRLDITDSRVIGNFITQYQGTFFAERLRNAWLDKLARNKKWSLFLQFYQSSTSTSLQCQQLQALINTGNQQQAFERVPELWLVPKSQDKACDPIFNNYQKKGLLTDAIRWQRIELALKHNQYSLATYLAKSLKDSAQATAWIELWKKTHDNPLASLKQLPSKNTSSQSVSLTQDTPLSRSIIAHGIERLAKKSLEQAFQTWLRIKPAYQFSEQEKHDIQSSIANRAALNRDDNTLTYFDGLINEPWHVRAALWQQDWRTVQSAILNLDSEQQQAPVWQYWLGRSQAALGDKLAATQTYQGLIMERDYYAFLAADKLGLTYQMNHNPIVVTAAELKEFSQRPEVLRLHEFYALNMNLEARREAYQQRQSYTSRELQLLATITHQWGWHNQSIALLGTAQYWDALDIRFPVVYDSAILKASQKQGIDPSWLFGIARQESAFNPHARSHVGATGLMQLMPKTGELIAKLINRPLKNTSELLNPDRNIELGSAYLRRVYDQHQQNPVLATASYNAGPHRVANWLPNKTIDADIWVENIPFTETRRYTRNVLSYAAIFDYQRKQNIKPITERMPKVKPDKP